jgi:hypothetical protein
MWRKNLILSLVFAVALPFGNAGAAPTGLQDEAQPQVSTGDKGVTTAPALVTTLAVPAAVKWADRLAHCLAIGVAAVGAVAGVVQLLYIGKYWGEVGKGYFGGPYWYAKQLQNTQYWAPDRALLIEKGIATFIFTSVFAGQAALLYRNPPVMRPEVVLLETHAAPLFLWMMIPVPLSVSCLFLLMQGTMADEMPKGLFVQFLVLFGDILIFRLYDALRILYLNHKAAEALAHKANTGAVAGDQAKQLKLA